ncbi:putative FCH domain-containing protein [Seiridium cardinale]
MDDTMRVEYPSMLANLQPLQAVQVLSDRVKRISKLNVEIADWLQERRRVEEQYVQGLRKLTQFRVPNAQSELGTFQIQWDKIVQSSEGIAMSHHLFATKIEKDVETPLRTFHTKKEMQNIQTIQGNLHNMAKELDDAQKKSEALNKKAGKTSAAKMDQAASRLESATNQWESQAPFVFETLQALDETRLNQIRDVLTQYGTYEGEQVQQKQAEAESVLNSLLDYHTGNEIQAFMAKTTAGKAKVPTRTPLSTTRTSSSIGGANTSLAPPSINAPPPAPSPVAIDDARSSHSGHREEKGGENKLRSRIGTMLGRRRQSIHGGFGQLSPSKGPFGRGTKSSHGVSPRASSSNLAESNNKLPSLVERPNSPDEGLRLSETQEKSSHEGPNGFGGDGAMDTSSTDPTSTHVNGTGTKLSSDIADVPPPPGPPPSQKDPEKDAEGFSVPAASDDPISAAQREAAGTISEEGEPAFKLNIQKEPVADEDPEERQAALSNFTNSLSALGMPTRRAGTVRGRRDVRNTIYVPAPVSESSPLPALNFPSSSSKPNAVAALTSEASVAGTSDTQSIRSSNSLNSIVHFKHPDMHEPGLNSSIMETISATFEGGQMSSVKVNGEIAFSFNPTDPSGSQTHQAIRVNNFSALEVIGPNRIFVANHTPDQPDQFTLDLSHLRPNQATVGFSYRLHVEPASPPTDHVPILLNPLWKPQGDKLGLLLQYKLNPAFKLSNTITLHNVVFLATYEGKASGAQTKPSGTHLKEKHLVYWRLGDITLDASQDWHKIVCRIIGEAGVEPKPGTVEARWEFSPAGQLSDGITISRLEESKGKEVELSDDDPFADAGASDNGEGRWVDVPAVRRFSNEMAYTCFYTLAWLFSALVRCHIVISYPGWRGNNLIVNGSVEDTNGLGTGISSTGEVYPYGMQWIYPCGGMPITSNRTQWPVSGGAVAFQPGWFTGHEHALIYINVGFGAIPTNYSVPLLPPFEIIGPSNNPYPGTVCQPFIPIPSGYDVKPGDLATIQVIEAAVHGAGMYSCVDITFVEGLDAAHEMNETNCFNSTDISFAADGPPRTSTNATNTTGVTYSTVAPTQTVTAIVTAACGVVFGPSELGVITMVLIPLLYLLG